jgi:NitT/TauT family transport system ATP-binding protein
VPIAIPRDARADAEIAAIKAGLAQRIQRELGDERAGRDVS